MQAEAVMAIKCSHSEAPGRRYCLASTQQTQGGMAQLSHNARKLWCSHSHCWRMLMVPRVMPQADHSMQARVSSFVAGRGTIAIRI